MEFHPSMQQAIDNKFHVLDQRVGILEARITALEARESTAILLRIEGKINTMATALENFQAAQTRLLNDAAAANAEMKTQMQALIDAHNANNDAAFQSAADAANAAAQTIEDTITAAQASAATPPAATP